MPRPGRLYSAISAFQRRLELLRRSDRAARRPSASAPAASRRRTAGSRRSRPAARPTGPSATVVGGDDGLVARVGRRRSRTPSACTPSSCSVHRCLVHRCVSSASRTQSAVRARLYSSVDSIAVVPSYSSISSIVTRARPRPPGRSESGRGSPPAPPRRRPASSARARARKVTMTKPRVGASPNRLSKVTGAPRRGCAAAPSMRSRSDTGSACDLVHRLGLGSAAARRGTPPSAPRA